MEMVLKTKNKKFLQQVETMAKQNKVKFVYKKIIKAEGFDIDLARAKTAQKAKEEPSYIPNEAFAKRLREAREDIKNDKDILHFNSNDEAFAYLRGLMKKTIK